MKTISKAKPFIKWVGGKGQLIEQLDAQLPEDFENWDDVTYIEPFVGGGAMLFSPHHIASSATRPVSMIMRRRHLMTMLRFA